MDVRVGQRWLFVSYYGHASFIGEVIKKSSFTQATIKIVQDIGYGTPVGSVWHGQDLTGTSWTLLQGQDATISG